MNQMYYECKEFPIDNSQSVTLTLNMVEYDLKLKGKVTFAMGDLIKAILEVLESLQVLHD